MDPESSTKDHVGRRQFPGALGPEHQVVDEIAVDVARGTHCSQHVVCRDSIDHETMRAIQPRERDMAVLDAVGQIELGQVVKASVDHESLSRVHAVGRRIRQMLRRWPGPENRRD